MASDYNNRQTSLVVLNQAELRDQHTRAVQNEFLDCF